MRRQVAESDMTFTEFELAVITKALAGSHPTLVALRAQFATASLVSREMTGVGFFLSISIGPEAMAIAGKKDVEVTDVIAQLPGLKHGAGFVLFIRDGFIKVLEGYTYDEPWPAQIDAYELAYAPGEDRTRTIADLDQALHEHIGDAGP